MPVSIARLDAATKIALAVLGFMIAAALLAPVAAPYDPNVQPDIVGLRSQGPSLAHPFGTDQFSRDILSRVMHGARISLGVAISATVLSVVLGTAYGAMSGYAGGRMDTLMMRLLDAMMAIPRLLILVAILAAWRNLSIPMLVLVIAGTGWFGLSRMVRGQVLALKDQDFVVSARALGAGTMRIVGRHILPNAMSPILVAAAIGIGHVIALEAGLSYLGIGIQQPTASWGNIIRDGSDQLASHWWISFFPGLAIVLTVMAFNILGDSVRDHFGARRPGDR